MENLKIETAISDKYISDFRINGIYLHGKLEKDMKYDIFSFNKKVNFSDGIHQLTVNGKDCTLFIWRAEMSGFEKRGYLIYTDCEEYEYCENKFNRRSQIL